MTNLEISSPNHKFETVEYANIKNSNKVIKLNDMVNVEIEGKLVLGIVEKICPAIVEFLIKIRFNKRLYTTINTKYIEYRNYGDKGFYRVGCKYYVAQHE